MFVCVCSPMLGVRWMVYWWYVTFSSPPPAIMGAHSAVYREACLCVAQLERVSSMRVPRKFPDARCLVDGVLVVCERFPTSPRNNGRPQRRVPGTVSCVSQLERVTSMRVTRKFPDARCLVDGVLVRCERLPTSARNNGRPQRLPQASRESVTYLCHTRSNLTKCDNDHK
jgi:hypothetical protein